MKKILMECNFGEKVQKQIWGIIIRCQTKILDLIAFAKDGAGIVVIRNINMHFWKG